MKKLKLFLLLVSTVTAITSFAQNVDQGKKFFYYERFKSAEEQFSKVLASNPNNIEANYWLGQTMIRQKDSVGAKALYQKALSSSANAPLLLAGMGQINLMDGKTDEARQLFETALSLTKGNDLEVIHAIARANIEAPMGDAKYALEKLNAAATGKKKDPRNAESYLLIGKANRKLIEGGAAVTAFQQAASMDPKLAAAKFETGRVYLTQNNPEFFLPAFEEATKIDPKYAPAYYDLFYYWFNRDINKAREYFDKYLAVADVQPSNEYDRTSILYAAKNFQGAVDSAKAKISELGDKADPRYYKLIAYSYDELKDSANAKNYLDQYFAKQAKGDFVPQDYVFRAKLLSKFPGNEAEALKSFETAVQLDTSKESQLKLMQEAAVFSNKAGNYMEEANWLSRIYKSKKDPTNRDLYDLGYAYYHAGNFPVADSIFCGEYSKKYPTEIFGYLWCARAAGAQDTTMEKGLAVEPYKRLVAFADTAREKYKGTLIQAYGYLSSYYANVAKDKDSAVGALQKILEIDPDNASAKQYIEVLTKPAAKTPAKAPAKTPATKPKTPAKKK